MPPFKRILFPVDLSEKCSAFAPYVAAVAKRFHADVTLLHVIDSTPFPYNGADPALAIAATFTDFMSERRRKELDEFLTDVFKDMPVKRITMPGEAGSVIAEYARANGIQLIMMPTHGYGRFRSLLLGSVAAKVLHDAKCPVWTSAHAEEIHGPVEPEFQNILCAVEAAQEAPALVRSAAEMAGRLGGTLRLVHAIPVIEAATELSLRSLGTPEELFDHARQEIQQIQTEAGTNAELCLEPGDVSAVVQRCALRHKAALVITGRGRLHETLGSLRTHSYAIIRDAPCPVLSIDAGAPLELALVSDFAENAVLCHG